MEAKFKRGLSQRLQDGIYPSSVNHLNLGVSPSQTSLYGSWGDADNSEGSVGL